MAEQSSFGCGDHTEHAAESRLVAVDVAGRCAAMTITPTHQCRWRQQKAIGTRRRQYFESRGLCHGSHLAELKTACRVRDLIVAAMQAFARWLHQADQSSRAHDACIVGHDCSRVRVESVVQRGDTEHDREGVVRKWQLIEVGADRGIARVVACSDEERRFVVIREHRWAELVEPRAGGTRTSGSVEEEGIAHTA